MRGFTVLSFALATGMTTPAVHADPRPTPSVTCDAGGLAARPQFTQISPGRAEYSFTGVCTTREGRYLGYRLTTTWTPSETSPNANASEIYRIDTLSGPSQSFDVVFGASCRADPWLNDAPCKRVGDNLPDELRDLWPELGTGLFPYSRNLIPRDQRAALRAEYDRANGRFDRSRVLSDHVRSDAVDVYGAAEPAAQRSDIVQTVIDAVALNPQPLPPEPPEPDRNPPAQTVAPPFRAKAAKAGITIIGSRAAYRRIPATTATPAADVATPATQPQR